MKKRFAEELVKVLEGKVGEGCKLSVVETKKNNGIVYTGISFAEGTGEVAKIFYVDDLFGDVDKGVVSIEEAAEAVAEWYEYDEKVNAKPEIPVPTQEWIRQNVVCCVVNAEMNKELLEGVPHKMFEDLAVVYRCIVQKDNRGVASFILKNGMCNMALDELHKVAMDNTEKKSGFEYRNLSLMIGMPEQSPIWVMTNKESTNGASVILFGHHFEMLSEILEEDLYVMPSSIHEVLAIPASLVSVEEARAMVRDANRTVVNQEEILSNNVYFYSKAEGTLRIA